MKALSFKTSLVFLFLSVLLVVACEKDNPETSGIKDSSDVNLSYQGRTVHIEAGRLVFRSAEDAMFIQKELNRQAPVLLDALSSLKNFTSSWSAFERFTDECIKAGTLLDIEEHQSYAHLIQDNKGEVYLEPVVDDPVLRYLTNADGVFQIGERVYKVAFEEASVLDAQQYDKHGFSEAMAVEQIPIIRHKVSSYEKVNIDACDGKYDNNKRKVNGELEERSDLFSSNVDCIVRTKHHKKQGFVWFREEAATLRHQGEFTVNYDPNAAYWVFDEQNNTREISTTFFTGPNAMIYQGSATHTAIDAGKMGQCSTYAPYPW